ncbi:amino acid adenylation domain-containing protein [Pseudomonas sp. NFACC02]|uniref:non-ribosomal peptide synthetase n=1 Tax=Pseudomonas sp. NFACC02 TaxID=1566250 RepID=UPI0008C2CABC|nr:non-ribosomal peptide synthetase [Pseudomonas sp. NFACC02]SEQ54797.1 amino acid adenylation domain-containing protein [Pseudomonas sp. NFACC02]
MLPIITNQLKQVKSVPLLRSQEGMWFTEQLDISGLSQIVSVCVNIRGHLCHQALTTAIQGLVTRHDNLRTRFVVEESEPRQRIQGKIDTQLKYIDMRSSTTNLDESLRTELAIPMDVENGPLFRATLYEVDDSNRSLLFTIHHLLMDNQSTEYLIRDFYGLYDAAVFNAAPQLPVLPFLYSEYSQNVRAQTFESERIYWQKEMENLPTPLLFARGQHIEPTGLRSANTIKRKLDTSSTLALRSLGVKSGFTPFMVHLAISAALLQRHTGSQDIVLGVPLSTRPGSGTSGLTGLFVNTMPLRLRFPPDISFEKLLQLVRVRLLRAMMHVKLPLHELIRTLRLQRDAGSNPLFKVCVNHAVAEKQKTNAGRCEFELRALPSLKSAFEVNLMLIESSTSCEICLEFDEDALSSNDAKEVVSQYLDILAAASAMPSLHIQDIPLFRPQLQRTTSEPGPNLEPVHIRFERQASNVPTSVAVIYGEQQASYAELNAKANRLAMMLIEMGVNRETLVAICTDRSLDMVVSVLATMKAGGVYIPIDQDNPEERVRYILKDTKTRILLTSTSQKQRFRDMPTTVLCVDDDNLCASYAEQNPENRVDPDNLVYCVYTSGSTGRPKGALNTHAGFANLVDWYVTQGLNMSASARVMLASSFGFDTTQKNLLGPLCVGATLIIPPCLPTDHIAFTNALKAYRPSWLNCAPSAFRTFMNAPGVETISTLILSGEPLDEAIVKALQGKPVNLVNAYGPSECADICISFARSMSQAICQDSSMPLGTPIPNVEIYVLDDQFQHAPAGVSGHLYISGVGLGRGYLGRPDLTAQQFLPNPFGRPGSRMYRTGDIGRLRRDGVIEYLGRADNQIKLRGNRVEPGEIETLLRDCQGVAEAVVLLRDLGQGEPHLVAYVVPQKGETLTTDRLRLSLRAQLPEYMVPTAWMVLAAIPLNLNGKTDYKALPLPVRTAAGERIIYKPTTPTQVLLVDIWREVLDVPEVSIFDNFFDLWGQSLLAVRMAAMIADKLSVALPMRVIFDASNIVNMAAQIDQILATSGAVSPQLIKRQSREPIGTSGYDSANKQ